MNMFVKCRAFAFLCVLSILFSLTIVSVSATDVFPSAYRDTDCVSDWNAKIVNPSSVAMELAVQHYGASMTAESCFWSMVNVRLDGKCCSVTEADLAQWAVEFTDVFNRPYGDWFGSQVVYGTQDVIANSWAKVLLGKTDIKFSVRCYESSGLYRIYCDTVGLYVVDSSGKYPYYDPSDGKTDNWIALSTMNDKSIGRHVLDYAQLSAAAKSLGIKPSKYGDYWIIKKTGVGTQEWVYADENQCPYVAPYDKSQTATSTSRPTTSVKDENGDTVEDIPENSSTNIDLSGMTVTLPDGTFNFIDQLLYDESTKTYYIDSHDTYTTENNYYITNNYSWTYHINYTSITYIGQTEEYDKYYEVYYELPDGRDSADLTKEEVEQLNVSVDVIPYGRSADDTSLRSLYHFDGDTKDSSYWNYCTNFTWNKGASLTYMDAGVFNGALYLDETEHDFTLTLPFSIGVGDFTLQFRYYQSYTAAPQTDSYIKLGVSTVMNLNGSSFLSSDNTVLASTPIGSWNEIALIRESGILYYYLNGVSIGAVDFRYGVGETIVFHFGADQQTYKYFDELRVLNYALASSGADYECTSVPHDTNLTLILPTDSVAVADEYWSITSSKENLLSAMGYDSWSGASDPFLALDATFSLRSSSHWMAPSTDDFNVPNGLPQYPYFYYFSGLTSVCSYDNYMSIVTNELLDSTGGAIVPLHYIRISSGELYHTPTGGINSVLGVNWKRTTTLGLSSGTYTFSMVDLDGNVGSLTFTVPDSIRAYGGNSFVSSTTIASTTFNGCLISVWVMDYANDTSSVLYLSIQPTEYGVERCFTYLELVEGDSTDLSAEWVESVTAMDETDLNTPTLAVRTDLDITSYQIGGVRPSLPTKGQVWALVENERITSIQIYNGSAWEGVDGRIWTGERWIPASSYNIITLQDMYDIADATQDFEYIYSESGFWTWWQKSWNAFTDKLFSVLGSGGSGGTSITPSSVKDALSQALSSLIESIFGLITEVLKSLIGAAMDLISGMFGFLSETVLGGISGFFDALEELVNPFESTVTDEDGSSSTVIALPDDISTVFAFFSGLFMVLPEQLRIILFFGIGFMLVLAVFKLIRA